MKKGKLFDDSGKDYGEVLVKFERDFSGPKVLDLGPGPGVVANPSDLINIKMEIPIPMKSMSPNYEIEIEGRRVKVMFKKLIGTVYSGNVSPGQDPLPDEWFS